MSWDSNLYLKYKSEREEPLYDLISKLNGNYTNILDLGCGPGNSTRALKDKFNSNVVGIDIDDNMLLRARKDNQDIKFIKEDIEFFSSDIKYDLVFSNACLHWIKNQDKLLNNIYETLNNNGVFAMQIPLTDNSEFYKTLYELIDDKYPSLKKINNFHNYDAFGYYNVLCNKFKDIKIWCSDYYHIVNNVSDIISWYKGSGLRPYLDVLSDNDKTNFLNDLEEEISNKYTKLSNNKYFLIMPRVFIIAIKNEI